jgi:hypothetical protein
LPQLSQTKIINVIDVNSNLIVNGARREDGFIIEFLLLASRKAGVGQKSEYKATALKKKYMVIEK